MREYKIVDNPLIMSRLLTELCKEKGVAIAKIARVLKVKATEIYNLTSGRVKRINTETLNKLANYFGVSPNYLLTGEEDEKEVDPLAARVADLERRLKAAGPGLNKIVLNEYQKEIIEKKYFKGNGFLTVYTRMKQMTPEAKEVLYRLLWAVDEVIRRENYKNEGAGKP